MYNRSALAVILGLASLLSQGCRQTAVDKAKTALLTRAAWKYQKIGFDSKEDGYIDVLGSRLEDCAKDDITIFNADGSGTCQTGPLKCDPADPTALPFRWSFENHDSTLYFEEQHFKVKTLSENKLEIYNEEHLGGTNVRYIISFGH